MGHAAAHKTQRKRAFFGSEPRHGHHWEWAHEVLSLLCNIAFLIGSACFMSDSDSVFAFGDWLFIVGAVVGVLLTGNQLHEQMMVKKHHNYLLTKERDEIMETIFYMTSSIAFAIGCIFFMPGTKMEALEEQTGLGAGLCILGSFLLVWAAHFNALAFSADRSDSQKTGIHPNQESFTKTLSLIGLSCTLGGAVLYTCGSFMYRPSFDGICVGTDGNKRNSTNEVCAKVADYGTLLYLIGSALFVAQSIISLACLCIKQAASDGAEGGDGEAQKLVQSISTDW